MEVKHLQINDVLLLKPRVFSDGRGFFLESYNQRQFCDIVGTVEEFVQDNHSRSDKGVLRGLHYQIEQAQGKLVRVVRGEIFDVAVDMRQGSPSFGQWVGERLSADNQCQLWVPAGFAHGFYVCSDGAEVLYKTTNYYAPEHERCVLWNDPDLAIDWPLDGEPILSEKDQKGVAFKEAETFS